MARRRRGSAGLWTLIVIGATAAFIFRPPSSTIADRVDDPAQTPTQVIAQPLKSPAAPVVVSGKTTIAFVTASKLNVRGTPSGDGAKLGTFSRGTQVEISEIRDGWAAIPLSTGEIGWVSADFLSQSPPAPVASVVSPVKSDDPRATVKPSREEAVSQLMAQSMASYSGNCPCPENRDRAGRRCGARSAWSRGGGASPLCYPGDVTDTMIERYLGGR